MASKISFVIKLEDIVPVKELNELTASAKREVSAEVGEFVVDKILEDTSNSRSAVTGQRWKGLSADYKKTKTKIASGSANLELHGDMLDALKVRPKPDQIEIGIFTKLQAQKADGHTHHGVFGVSKLPTRKFMPLNNGKLRPGIMKEVIRAAKQIVDDAPKRQRTKKSKTSLLSTLAKFALTKKS